MSGSIWPDDSASSYDTYEAPEPEPVPEARAEFAAQALQLETRIRSHRENFVKINQRAGLDSAYQAQLELFQAVEALNRQITNETERDLHNNCRMAQINTEALLAHQVGEVAGDIPADYIARAYPGLRTALEKEQLALALRARIDKIKQLIRQWEKSPSLQWVDAISQQVTEFYQQYRDMTLEGSTRNDLLGAAVDEFARSEAARVMIAHPDAHVQSIGAALMDHLTIQPYPVIAQALKNPTPTVRESGVKCFGRGKIVQADLLGTAADPDISVRDATSEAFRQTVSLLPKYLSIALGDEDPFIRRAALELTVPPDFCAAENKTEWKKVCRHLLTIAERDPHLDIREKATRLLGWFPDPTVTTLLKRLSARQNGQPEAIRQAAVQSLAMQRLLE